MIDTDKAFTAFKKKYDAMSSEEKELYLKKMGFSFDPQSVIQEITPVIRRAAAYSMPKSIPQKAKKRPQTKKGNQSNKHFVVKRYK